MILLNYPFVFGPPVVSWWCSCQVLRVLKIKFKVLTFEGLAREDELINLKRKLKVAVERIKELSKERSKLINVGNRMKAELATIKGMEAYLKSQNFISKFTSVMKIVASLFFLENF